MEMAPTARLSCSKSSSPVGGEPNGHYAPLSEISHCHFARLMEKYMGCYKQEMSGIELALATLLLCNKSSPPAGGGTSCHKRHCLK